MIAAPRPNRPLPKCHRPTDRYPMDQNRFENPCVDQPALSTDELEGFLNGSLTDNQFEQVMEHLDRCDLCRSASETLSESSAVTKDGVWLARLGDASASQSQFLFEPDCMAALYNASVVSDRPQPSSPPPVDSLGVYRLIRPLGQGGMGTVYLAEHEKLKRRCAIKLLHRDRNHSETWRARFDREMHAVASLRHPNLVAATDAGEHQGWNYLVMEYLEGLDLATLIQACGKIDPQTACGLMSQICRGLAAMHDAGLVHRDIKPSNLMLTRDGEVKVLDLGLVADSNREDELRLTTVGHIVGTLLYAAPEQLKNDADVGPQADVYGVGCTLYQLLSGQPPFQANQNLAALAIEKSSHVPRSLGILDDALPRELTELVDRLLSIDPVDRPSDILQIADQLDSIYGSVAAAEFKALAKRGMRASAEQSHASPSALVRNTRSIGMLNGKSDQDTKRRRRSAIAGGIGLLTGGIAALIAAITFYVSTDNGMLVIESTQDDITIQVTRDNQVVESLEVDTGESQTILRSGSYQVQLSEGSDSVSLSDNKVTLRRGEKVILKIAKKKDSIATNQAQAGVAKASVTESGVTKTNRMGGPSSDFDNLRIADNSSGAQDTKFYKGKSLGYWIATMESEHDVETLQTNMQAIIAIAGSDDVDAFHSILKVSRRLGGWMIGTDDASGQFMEALVGQAEEFLPSPGFDAIIKELDDPNRTRQSELACFLLISRYSAGGRLMKWALENPQPAERFFETYQNAFHKFDRDEKSDPSIVGTLDAQYCCLARALNQSIENRLPLKRRLQQRIESLQVKLSPTERMIFWLGNWNDDDLASDVPKQSLMDFHQLWAARKMGIEVPLYIAVPSLLSIVPYRQDQYLAIEDLNHLMEETPTETADEILAFLVSNPIPHASSFQIGGASIYGGGAGGGGMFGAVGVQGIKGMTRLSAEKLLFQFSQNKDLFFDLLPEVVKHTSRADLACRTLAKLEKANHELLGSTPRRRVGALSMEQLTALRSEIENTKNRVNQIDLSKFDFEAHRYLTSKSEGVVSADQRYIAFSGNTIFADNSRRSGVVFVYDRVLCEEKGYYEGLVAEPPVWSPDSKYLAFCVRDDKPYRAGTLSIFNNETGETTHTEIASRHLAWSPSSDQIAAVSNSVRNLFISSAGIDGGKKSINIDGQILIYDLDTGRQQLVGMPPVLTNQKVSGSVMPAWSPSGSRLAWLHLVHENKSGDIIKNMKLASAFQSDVWTCDADGGNVAKAIDDSTKFHWEMIDGKEVVTKNSDSKDVESNEGK